MSTTCKLEYRTYIPHGVIAIPFCHVTFTGSDWTKHQRQCDQLQQSATLEAKKQHQSSIDNSERRLESYKMKLANLEDDRKWWQKLVGIPTPYVVERDHLENDIYKETLHLDELKKDNYDLEDIAYYKKDAIYDYLRKHGFTIIHTDTEVDCVTTTTEIWERK